MAFGGFRDIPSHRRNPMSNQLAVGALLACVLAAAAVAAMPAASAATSPTDNNAVSACDLLSDQEIAAVQGESVSARRGWAATGAGPGASTCYFELPTASKSITLMFGVAEGESPRKARLAWKQQFEPHQAHDRDAGGREREEEEEEEGAKRRPPQKVRGLGDAAYWRATPVGGTLYVLKGQRYFALTIGGRKVDEVRAMARSVLKHL
jgi:hypothetical protein